MRGYRAHLDGLRGVAIALVLCAHFTGARYRTGFAGVAAFFALSGFLITGLLLDEHARAGRVDLFAFYARRVGRLLPGLLAVVAVIGPLVANDRGAVIAALTYTTNYANIGGHLPRGPFMQTWSLGIEEHFYLAWAPILLLAARRGGAATVMRVALVGAGISTAFRFGVAGLTHSAAWVTWGSLCRGDALLLGCAAAAAVRLGWRPSWLSLPLGLVLFAAAITMARPNRPGEAWPLSVEVGVLAVASAALVVGLDAGPAWPRRLLACWPLRQLGVISYSLYLWHYPLLVIGGEHVWVLAASLGAAVASYTLVERPARDTVRAALASRGRSRPPRPLAEPV